MATFRRTGRALRAHDGTAAGRLAHTDDAVLPRLRQAGQDAGTSHLADDSGLERTAERADQHALRRRPGAGTGHHGRRRLQRCRADLLGTPAHTRIPAAWPGDRFDLIWSFTLQPGASSTTYAFSQIPQQVLSGDSATV